MHADLTEILFTEEQLKARVAELGAQIQKDYQDLSGLLVVSVLRGSAIFTADLVRCIELPMELDFMVASSYGDAASSSGKVRIEKDLATSAEGKHVLILEDILDTGLTLSCLMEELASRGAASVELATLLLKRDAQKVDIKPRYVGFECPGEFIVGYGLDYAQRYRNLPYIGILKPEVYSTPA